MTQAAADPVDEIDAELVTICTRHAGVLRAKDVVAFARNPKTALHECFEWDDSEAAEKYRQWQARDLIRVRVTVIDGVEESIRAYVSLMPDRVDGCAYRPMLTVLSSNEMRAQLLADAAAEFAVFRKKYGGIKALAKLFEEADRVL